MGAKMPLLGATTDLRPEATFDIKPSQRTPLPRAMQWILKRVNHLREAGIFGFLQKWDRLRFPPAGLRQNEWIAEERIAFRPLRLKGTEVQFVLQMCCFGCGAGLGALVFEICLKRIGF